MLVLENEYLKAGINPKGAELKSLWSKLASREYIWSGDPAFWAKTSPVLFPIVGALRDDTYIYKGQAYHLSRHGFGRDLIFTVEQINDAEALFTLSDSPETRAVYPFGFKLSLRYQLSGAGLSCSYEVYNPGTEPLIFSVGGHPAFAAGDNDGMAYNDWYLQFEQDDELVVHPIADNLISDRKETIPLEGHVLPLKHELFYNDALVLKDLKSTRISLLNKKDPHGLQISFPDFPYFGIWAARDANFVCLEPWCGIADGIQHNQQLEHKEGMNRLAASASWKRTWEVVSI